MSGASLNLVAAVLRTVSAEMAKDGIIAEISPASFNEMTSALGAIESLSTRRLMPSATPRDERAPAASPGPSDTTTDGIDALVATMIPKVSQLALGPDGATLTLTEGQEFFRVMTEAAQAVLGDAPNYVEMQMQSPAGGRYVVWIGRPNGLTPHEARQRAEARYALLRCGAMGERHPVLPSGPGTAEEFDAAIDALLAREAR
jgi:hypothetical protein